MDPKYHGSDYVGTLKKDLQIFRNSQVEDAREMRQPQPPD